MNFEQLADSYRSQIVMKAWIAWIYAHVSNAQEREQLCSCAVGWVMRAQRDAK